jgi:hypothetical protein
MDLRDRAMFAYLDWRKAETRRLTEIVREQCRAVLECEDLGLLANVRADVEHGKARFEIEGLEFEILIVPQACLSGSGSNMGVEGIHEQERIALYACINGHDYKIDSLADLGRHLTGVRDEAVGVPLDRRP